MTTAGYARALTVVLLVAGGVTGGCSRDASPDPVTPHVEVREVGDGVWRATWRFAEPVPGMRFARSARFFREDAWRVTTPGYRLARTGDSQVVLAASGRAPVAEIAIEFPVDTRAFSREYEFFQAFSDGSVALYTGMLHADALGRGGVVRDVRIDPGHDRRLVVRGDAGADGTYAYVGNIEPLRSAHMTAIIDPGLPAWLQYEAQARIATFFTTLAARTGHALDGPPLVLFNFVPDDRDGYAFRGGAVDGTVHMAAIGDGWHDPDPQAVRGMLRFIAHEAVHLWNSGLVRRRAGEPPWLHEGSADALADRLLVAAGIVDASVVDELTERALDECIGVPEWAPMSTTRADRAHYACGAVVSMWTEYLLQAADPGLDLFGFMGRLIDHARETGGYYTEDDWFSVLQALGADPVAVDRMRAFVRGRHANAADAWQRALARDGIEFE